MAFSLENLIITKIHGVYNINSKVRHNVLQKDRKLCALAYKTSGVTEYLYNGKHYRCDEKHAVLIPPNKPYYYNVLEQGTCCLVEFDCTEEIDDFGVFKVPESTKTRRIFADLSQLWAAKSNAYMLETMSLIYKLLYSVCVFGNVDYSVQKKEKALLPVTAYINENYARDDITNESLAEIAGMSTVYFRKLFTKRYGVSPMKYVANVKIETAKNLLLSGNLSVSEIAEVVGFSSVYSFSRAFKKAIGDSPTDFLKLNSDFSV